MPLQPYGDTTSPMMDAFRPLDFAAERSGPDPSVWQAVGAAFRQSNTVGSAMTNRLQGIDLGAPEEGFDSKAMWDEIKDDPVYAGQWSRFAEVRNRRGFTALKSQIDGETDDRKTLAASGWTGTAASAVASIIDLPSLIPGSALVRGATVGTTIARSALATGAAAALGAGVSELALQETQQIRPLGESIAAVGAGALFGTFLGGAAGAVMTKAERKAALRAFEKTRGSLDRSDEALSEIREGIASAQSAGAAAIPADTLEDLSIAGASAKAVGKMTAKLNPTLRAAQSPSAAHRAVMADVQETGFYLEKNLRGDGGVAVETAQKYWERGALGQAIERTRDVYDEAKKAGLSMSRSEFNEAVGRAMRRNDQGENEWVTQAAKTWRSALFDPLKAEAIATKIFDEDVSVTTAPSYLSRVYKSKLIEAEEAQFKSIVTTWLRGQIDAIEEAASRGAQKDGAPNVPEFVNAADKMAYIAQIANDIFSKLTGRSGIGEPAYSIVLAKRGPMKERTFSIPDALIERYLESDVEFIGRRYARTMGADVELARKFGKATMEDQIAKVRADYTGLREAAAAKGASEKELMRLSAREKRDIADLEGVRDVLRGQYKVPQQHTNFARILSAAQTFNYLRAMGSVLVNNLNDAVRPAMVHGLSRYMAEGIAPLATNLKAIRLSVKDAKILGAVTDRVLQSRLSNLAELADPYAMNSPIERFLDNVATVFSKATLMPWFNDMNRSIASVLTQNRILKNVLGDFDALSGKEKAYLGYVGVDRHAGDRIAAMFREFGEVDGNVHVPHTEQWTDDIARRAFAGALNKDLDSIIVQKGVGDVPLFANTPVGRAMVQFRSFALASNQRILMRGLQEGSASMATGIMGMTIMGMFSYWAMAQITGRELSNNPGTWISEGLDRSGLFSVAFEINNTYEKLGGNGVYSLAAGAFSDKMQKKSATRYSTRGVVEAYAGPTFGLAKDLATALSLPLPLTFGEQPDVKPDDITTARRLTPFASLPYFRWIIDGGFGLQEGGAFKGVVPELKEAVQ